MKKSKFKSQLSKLLAAIKHSSNEFDLKATQKACDELVKLMSDNLSHSPAEFANLLATELEAENDESARKLIDQLSVSIRDGSTKYSTKQIVAVLKTLKKYRQFDALADLADLYLSTVKETPAVSWCDVRLLYSQALIETGRIHPAIAMLNEIRGRISKNKTMRKDHVEQISECVGLLGRANKQLSVITSISNPAYSAELLNESLECYSSFYNDPEFQKYADRTWHGINIASLTRVAEKRGVSVKSKKIKKSSVTAKEIQNELDRRKDTSDELDWDKGTALEVSLLLGKKDDALKRTVEYVRQKHGKFKYGSTLRQLDEILKTDPKDKTNARILSLLQAMHLKESTQEGLVVEDLKHEQAVVEELLEQPQFEAVFDQSETKTIRWYKNGLKAASAVGRICRKSDGRGWGTGFLVKGSDVDPGLGDQLVLFTNSHVVSEDIIEQEDSNPLSLDPSNAEVTFHAIDNNVSYDFADLYRNSHRHMLDYSILTFVTPPAGIEPLKLTKVAPTNDGSQRLYLIGHPGGKDTIQFSLQNNKILGYEPPDQDKKKVKYRAPTEVGSSGSPVFNEHWKVFALHHASRNDANWAVLMSKILA